MILGIKERCFLMVSQNVKKTCHSMLEGERQREVFLLKYWVLLRFLLMVEMTLWQSGLFARLSSFLTAEVFLEIL